MNHIWLISPHFPPLSLSLRAHASITYPRLSSIFRNRPPHSRLVLLRPPFIFKGSTAQHKREREREESVNVVKVSCSSLWVHCKIHDFPFWFFPFVSLHSPPPPPPTFFFFFALNLAQSRLIAVSYKKVGKRSRHTCPTMPWSIKMNASELWSLLVIYKAHCPE